MSAATGSPRSRIFAAGCGDKRVTATHGRASISRESTIGRSPSQPLNVGPSSRGGELSALLRASGPDFDVDAFVADCGWRIARVFHRGDARANLPRARTGERKYEESGLNVVVSEAGLDD